jgi:nitrogen fixation NifU-like protein
MYNETVLQLFQNATNGGTLEGSFITGRAGVQGEGPFMRIHICHLASRIMEARFETYGCPAAIACGSWTAHWIIGKTAKEANMLVARDLITIMGGLPLGKEHCATLAIEALYDGIQQILEG